MSSIEVTAISLPKILKNLDEGEWLAPEFQRGFVWTTAQIIGLVNSIMDAKPIGMATLWQQEDKSDLPLEHISVTDDFAGDVGVERYFGKKDERPGRYYAILDGKQRSTAIAMVFGGLRATNGKRKYSGSYYLNAAYHDVQDRVVYLSKREVEQRSLDNIASYVQQTLFPLELDNSNALTQHFFTFISSIENDQYYAAGQIPSQEEKAKRQKVVQAAYEGIQATRLAVYIVPKDESLAEICDIFETLNTTGTKVSTVDLIHSWVYAETNDSSSPILLRDALDSLSDVDGMQGWPTSTNRPELMAQIVAAIQIALDKKHAPRQVTGKKETKISSIKSSDLLAISSSSWRDFFDQESFVASCFLDFQKVVAGGRFSLAQCPYPGVVNIYLALRWYREYDLPSDAAWSIDQLDRLYRAFFWRNTFSKRYDQGYLTRVGADVLEFKAFLNASKNSQADLDWTESAEKWLGKLPVMSSQSVIEENIEAAVSDGNQRGALRSGGLLLLHSRATRDVVEPAQDITNILSQHDLHHIYPKKWCKDNKVPENADYLMISRDTQDWINAPANLMPMSGASNKLWDSKVPSSALHSLGINTEKQFDLLDRYFVDEAGRKLLEGGPSKVGEFLEYRKSLLSKACLDMMKV